MQNNPKNNGGETDYWNLPENAKTINDLIEYKSMSFAQESIFKAAYRFGDKRHHSKPIRDLNKIIYYANRLIALLLKEEKSNE